MTGLNLDGDCGTAVSLVGRRPFVESTVAASSSTQPSNTLVRGRRRSFPCRRRQGQRRPPSDRVSAGAAGTTDSAGARSRKNRSPKTWSPPKERARTPRQSCPLCHKRTTLLRLLRRVRSLSHAIPKKSTHATNVRPPPHQRCNRTRNKAKWPARGDVGRSTKATKNKTTSQEESQRSSSTTATTTPPPTHCRAPEKSPFATIFAKLMCNGKDMNFQNPNWNTSKKFCFVTSRTPSCLI